MKYEKNKTNNAKIVDHVLKRLNQKIEITIIDSDPETMRYLSTFLSEGISAIIEKDNEFFLTMAEECLPDPESKIISIYDYGVEKPGDLE